MNPLVKKLTTGKDLPEPSPLERERWKHSIVETLRYYVPELVNHVCNLQQRIRNGEKVHLVVHQDAFSTEDDPDGCFLIGMFLRYARMKRVNVYIVQSDSEIRQD